VTLGQGHSMAQFHHFEVRHTASQIRSKSKIRVTVWIKVTTLI